MKPNPLVALSKEREDSDRKGGTDHKKNYFFVISVPTGSPSRAFVKFPSSRPLIIWILSKTSLARRISRQGLSIIRSSKSLERSSEALISGINSTSLFFFGSSV